MVAKVAFLVLLGTALVLASPAPRVYNNDLVVESSVDRSIEDSWKNLENKFSQAIDQIKATWEAVKEKGQKVNVTLKKIKEKGLALLEQAKDVYKQIILEGKEATPELKAIYKALKDLSGELKQTGSAAVQDAKKLVQEVVEAVKQKLASIKNKKQA